jgi:putative glutamine amidotransferase
MPPASSNEPRVGVPYRTRNEELNGLTGKLEKYLEAVRQAGGEPIPVSLGLSSEEVKQLARTLDAVVLPGSPADMDPRRFGATRHAECADADADRERIDFTLLEHCLAEGKPVLGICFGTQSLNVFLGGTLIQDIPSEVASTVLHDWEREKGEPEAFHAVRIEPESRLAQLAQASEAVVNSSHHQSIQVPGRQLRVTSRGPDGVIEAVEWTGDTNWIVGVQWHPERMAGTDALAQALFRSLVAAAATRKAPVRA